MAMLISQLVQTPQPVQLLISRHVDIIQQQNIVLQQYILKEQMQQQVNLQLHKALQEVRTCSTDTCTREALTATSAVASNVRKHQLSCDSVRLSQAQSKSTYRPSPPPNQPTSALATSQLLQSLDSGSISSEVLSHDLFPSVTQKRAYSAVQNLGPKKNTKRAKHALKKQRQLENLAKAEAKARQQAEAEIITGGEGEQQQVTKNESRNCTLIRRFARHSGASSCLP